MQWSISTATPVASTIRLAERGPGTRVQWRRRSRRSGPVTRSAAAGDQQAVERHLGFRAAADGELAAQHQRGPGAVAGAQLDPLARRGVDDRGLVVAPAVPDFDDALARQRRR